MDTFNDTIRQALRNPILQTALRKSTALSQQKRADAIAEIPEWEHLQHQASQIRAESVRHLAAWVRQFSERARQNGIRVHFASTAEDARAQILALLRAHGVRRVVKSKSMTTEEIELNPALERAGIQVVETDLGEYILQLAQEPPSHITAPALHKTREEIAALFRTSLGYTGPSDPEALTRFARETLRRAFLEAEAGITGANFLVAETGSLVIVENEGNARFTMTLPRLQIAVAGLDKVIPRWQDLAPLLRLLAPSATGQIQTTYISVISGPEPDPNLPGPEEIHLVLIDNGRSRIAQDPEFWEILKCIRCGACSLACPVFQLIGGQAYRTVYSGPVGIVLSPLLFPWREDLQSLPFLSSLCGACADVCPVKIDLPRLILLARSHATHRHSWSLRTFLRGWTLGMTHPALFRWALRILRPWLRALARWFPLLRPWTRDRRISLNPRRPNP